MVANDVRRYEFVTAQGHIITAIRGCRFQFYFLYRRVFVVDCFVAIIIFVIKNTIVDVVVGGSDDDGRAVIVINGRDHRILRAKRAKQQMVSNIPVHG
uniref:Uncharacterized protein n=1 Tax=Romanomermis culicivorax TaxID=13658 RepID=A0A915HGN3_ROMCU